MTAVSDTSPLHYLIVAGQVNLIQHIFSRVLIPRAVEQELIHRAAPKSVRQWMEQRPAWLEIRDLAQPLDPALVEQLDRGEVEAIHLATSLDAHVLIVDDLRGRQIAALRKLDSPKRQRGDDFAVGGKSVPALTLGAIRNMLPYG